MTGFLSDYLDDIKLLVRKLFLMCTFNVMLFSANECVRSQLGILLQNPFTRLFKRKRKTFAAFWVLEILETNIYENNLRSTIVRLGSFLVVVS